MFSRVGCSMSMSRSMSVVARGSTSALEEPVRHCPSTAVNNAQASALFSAPKNPQRIHRIRLRFFGACGRASARAFFTS